LPAGAEPFLVVGAMVEASSRDQGSWLGDPKTALIRVEALLRFPTADRRTPTAGSLIPSAFSSLHPT
jgi:hypothetical protein